MIGYTAFQLTRNCSAKCTHCFSYSDDNEQNKLLELDKMIAASPENLILLTGGEPLDSEHFSAACKLLAKRNKYFRVATSGHICFPRDNNFLKNDYLTGISLSLDVLSDIRSPGTKFRDIWHNNLTYTVSSNIPFSLTITILNESDIDHFFKILRSDREILSSSPSFIMIMLHKDLMNSNLEDKTNSIFSSLFSKSHILINQLEF